ncbi:class I SAM-dependent methyltransferase [Asanoa iriomotensis]|nr:class I SAM-dependent methyltransferase [Asanoa iriomotensis]
MPHDHLIEMLDLDTEVLHDYHRELVAWVGREAPDHPRVVDLGAGSGTGSLALARELAGAQVTAVDVDPEMLAHLRAKVDAAGLADRIHTRTADLDQPWPDFGPTDVIWAASAMHHMADPEGALAEAFKALGTGGLLVIAELDSFPRFLSGTPDEDVEERGHAALDRLRHEAGMHMHEDWGDRARHAGFHTVTRRRFDIDLRPPLPAPAPRYAEVVLHRMRDRLDGLLSTADLARLAAPRGDISVRTTRTVWLARR